MNKVFLIGNLTKDVELEKTTNGLSVAKFSVAVARPFSQDKQADFINCISWRGQAENLSKYCKKGDKVSIVGRIETSSYDAKDGTKKYKTEVVCEEIEFLNTKKTDSKDMKEIEPDDRLPF